MNNNCASNFAEYVMRGWEYDAACFPFIFQNDTNSLQKNHNKHHIYPRLYTLTIRCRADVAQPLYAVLSELLYEEDLVRELVQTCFVLPGAPSWGQQLQPHTQETQVFHINENETFVFNIDTNHNNSVVTINTKCSNRFWLNRNVSLIGGV